MSNRFNCANDARCAKGAEPARPDRRAVLRAGAAGSALVVVLPLACMTSASPPNGPIAAGNITDAPVGTLRVLTTGNAVLGRDAGGLYGMSAVCTHAGCLLSEAGSAAAGLDCGCHGSQFDSAGAVTRGPAGTPLQHYQVDLATDGTITIQGSMPVASTVRTAVA